MELHLKLASARLRLPLPKLRSFLTTAGHRRRGGPLLPCGGFAAHPPWLSLP